MKEGVEADNDKICAMTNWSRPRNTTGLRGFLGLMGYYRRLVQDYRKIVAPLTKLLHKDRFMWTYEASIAFEALKKDMVTIPVLALPDFSSPLIIEIDVSGTDLGVVLTQNSRPIA